MAFETSIFISSKKPLLNLTLSEKLTFYSIFTCVSCCLILILNQRYFEFEIVESILKYLAISSLANVFTGMTIRFWEYENLNGSFKGRLKIDLNSIIVDDSEYLLSDIQNFKIAVSNYKGQRTNYSKSGPSFYQGISNSISFIHNSESVSANFLLRSENQMDDLYNIIVSLITKEKINYSRNLINLIPDNYRNSEEFKNFILKLIVEKRLECTEGLLIHGYFSDEEAKQLRAKYCQ